MLSHRVPEPTEPELKILQVLWKRGPLTARQVHEALKSRVAITTVHTWLNRMVKKRLLRRELQESSETHVYRAAIDETTTASGVLGSFLSRFFDGSPLKLMQNLFSARDVDPAELDELDELIRRKRKKRRRRS